MLGGWCYFLRCTGRARRGWSVGGSTFDRICSTQVGSTGPTSSVCDGSAKSYRAFLSGKGRGTGRSGTPASSSTQTTLGGLRTLNVMKAGRAPATSCYYSSGPLTGVSSWCCASSTATASTRTLNLGSVGRSTDAPDACSSRSSRLRTHSRKWSNPEPATHYRWSRSYDCRRRCGSRSSRHRCWTSRGSGAASAVTSSLPASARSTGCGVWAVATCTWRLSGCGSRSRWAWRVSFVACGKSGSRRSATVPRSSSSLCSCPVG